MDLREIRWLEDGLYGPGVDGHDRHDDTDQEERGELVDVFHPNEDDDGHETETDAAVNSHVVQHGAVPSVDVSGVEYGRLRYQIFLWKWNNKSNRGLFIYRFIYISSGDL